MTEDHARFIDSMCKIIAACGFILGGAWTLVTYFDQREKDAKTAAVEARTAFFEKRQELYFEAVNAASVIVSSHDEKVTGAATDLFWQLYWGPLVLVEDKSVESSMVLLGRCIEAKKCERPMDMLALELSENCRNSLADSWQTELPKGSVTKSMLDALRH